MERIAKISRYLKQETAKHTILDDILHDILIIRMSYGNLELYFHAFSSQDNSVAYLMDNSQEYIRSINYKNITAKTDRTCSAVNIFKSLDPEFDMDKINIDEGYVMLVIAQLQAISRQQDVTRSEQPRVGVQSHVVVRAEKLSTLQPSPIQIEPVALPSPIQQLPDINCMYHCKLCKLDVCGKSNWHAHLHGSLHLKRTSGESGDIFHCDVCNVSLFGTKNMEDHCNGRKHLNNVSLF